MSVVTKTFDISLDTKREDSNRAFHLIEGDTGNILHITLTDDNVPVDLTGTLINLIVSSRLGVRSQTNDPLIDDNGITIGGADNNEITVDLFCSTYGVGLNEAEIQIYSKSEGDEYDVLVTTARFNFDCVRALVNADTIEAVREFPILSALILQTQQALAEALPWTDVTVTAVAGNEADVTVTATEDSISMAFVIPNGVYLGDTPPTGDEEVWIIPDGDDTPQSLVMSTAVYDQDNSGIVDDAEALGGHAPAYYATAAGLTAEESARIAADSAEVTARDNAIATAVSAVTSKKGAANGYATLDANTKVTATEASARIVTIAASVSSKTLALTDAGTFQQIGGACTITIPANSSVAFPVGTEIEFCRYGSGAVSFTGATGVTLRSAGSAKTISLRYGTACIKKLDTDTWLLSGMLEV